MAYLIEPRMFETKIGVYIIKGEFTYASDNATEIFMFKVKVKNDPPKL
jgi:hypothetical protein